MTYVTTNVRLPKNLYFELKTQAARERKSIAALLRERLSTSTNKNTAVMDQASSVTPEFTDLLAKVNKQYGAALQSLAKK